MEQYNTSYGYRTATNQVREDIYREVQWYPLVKYTNVRYDTDCHIKIIMQIIYFNIQGKVKPIDANNNRFYKTLKAIQKEL